MSRVVAAFRVSQVSTGAGSSAFDTWGKQKMLVGTSTGTLLVLALADDDGPAQIEIAKKGFCKKAIEQIHIIDHLNLLLLLSDGVIQTYSVRTKLHIYIFFVS
jgi:hypothetical protein